VLSKLTAFNVNDLHSFAILLKKQRNKDLKNSGLNHDLCDAGAVLHQLTYQANSELAIMWVNHKLVDGEYMRKTN